MERIKGVRSVCLGVWVKVGSRFEPNNQNGISHFLEHMFFKGTKRYSQKEIAYEIDSLGGDLNAFTSKESTTFYIKLLDEYIQRGTELLMEIFLHSVFPEVELLKERNIVIEEIRMVEDAPDDYVHDLFSAHVWGNEGLGLSVLGTEKTVRSFTRKALMQYVRRYYSSENIVVSCTGNIEFDRLIDDLNSRIGSVRNSRSRLKRETPRFREGIRIVSKDHSEVHICMGVEGIPQGSPERYALLLLNTIIGSGVSSRLFQEIRERRALAYSVYSYISSYMDAGLFGVYVGTARKNYKKVIDLVRRELTSFADTVKDDELQRAKKHLKGNLILALESTSGRMNNIARQEIYYGRYYSPTEIMGKIDRVDLKELKGLAERLFSEGRFALTLLGPVSDAHL